MTKAEQVVNRERIVGVHNGWVMLALAVGIVHGAVSMVHMALQELADKGVVQLDDERRAAMVSNLMVVLCGESEVHPVVNTGTLYT